MPKNESKKEYQMCDCATCCEQIPKSAAVTAEGKDYVYYFCGEKCYEKWHTKHQEKSSFE